MAKATAPKTAPKASAKPGTEAPEAQVDKPKTKKQPYPLKEGEKLKAAPQDYDPKKHQRLKKKDFEDESYYLEWQADELEGKAKAMRRRAEEFRKLGGGKAAAKVKQFIKLKEKIAALSAGLEDEGVDMDEILKSLEESVDSE